MLKQYFGMCVVLVAILASCSNRVTSAVVTGPPPGESAASLQENPRILLLQFTAFKTGTGKDSIILSSANVVPGFLKEDMTETPSVVPAGKLRCTLLDKNNNPIKSTVIDYPLERSLEIPPRNKDEEQHAHSHVNVEKSSFLVRARFTSAAKYITIEKSDKNGNPEYHFKFDMPLT